MIAVIAGATGLVGSKLLLKLLVDPEVKKVISVGRRSCNLKHLKLQELIIPNFSTIKNMTEELKADVYFCCLGTTIKAAGSKENFRKIDHTAVIDFAWLAQENKARSFTMVSAYGANSESRIFYNRVKGETENTAIGLNIRRVTILRPSLLMGARKSVRFVENMATVVMENIGPFLPPHTRRKLMTSADDVAKRMLYESTVSAAGVFIIEATEI